MTKPLLQTWCGSKEVILKSSGSSVLVVFYTDQHLTGKGFALKYNAVDNCKFDDITAILF